MMPPTASPIPQRHPYSQRTASPGQAQRIACLRRCPDRDADRHDRVISAIATITAVALRSAHRTLDTRADDQLQSTIALIGRPATAKPPAARAIT